MSHEEESSVSKVGVSKSPVDNVSPSPYTLSRSDNPSTLISHVVLNGDNYHEWSREMLNALQAKRKTGFVNGTIRQPASNSPDLEDWKTVNSMIIGWIRASIEPKVKSTVTFISDAYQLWEEMKKRFSVGNKVRVHQIKAQLVACQQKGQSVLEYYGRLCNLWEELQVVCPLPLCTCGAAAVISKERDEERIHKFLMGLDDSHFGGLCANIIGTDPMPSLGEVYSKVIREEDRLSSNRVREQQTNAVGFLTHRDSEQQSRTNHSNRPESSLLQIQHDHLASCSHCGRAGHEKKDCCQIIGFPEW